MLTPVLRARALNWVVPMPRCKILRRAALIPIGRFLSTSCLAYYRPRMIGKTTANLRHVSYSRIRVSKREDIERLYPLLVAYVANPALAETVTELTIDTIHFPKRQRETYPKVPQEPETDEERDAFLSVRDAAHVSIDSHVRSLGLANRTANVILKALKWQKCFMAGLWSGSHTDEEDGVRRFGLAATTILLSLCPNITTLYVGGLDHSPLPLNRYLLESNYGTPRNPGLQRLQQVYVLGHDYDRMTVVEFLEYFQFFHHLPQLRSISMEGANEYQASRLIFPPRTGTMKSIHITHSDVSSELLHTILSIPKSLEDAKITIGGLESRPGGGPIMVLRTISRALIEYRTTLKRLDLDLDITVQGDYIPKEEWEDEFHRDGGRYEAEEVSGARKTEARYYGKKYLQKDYKISSPATSRFDRRKYGRTIGSLHDFTALTHLSIGIKTLLGPLVHKYKDGRRQNVCHLEPPPFRLVDALPPNLEYFCLRGYARGKDVGYDSHVDEFLRLKEERFPALVESRGLEETVKDIEMLYGNDGYTEHPDTDSPDEERFAERVHHDLSWKEV